jgi:D-alanyl-D-alanine carboxypeptidase/D-alanyl-D-alanine-endopeptidase (penicillin-binding protein 4)
VRTGWVFVVLMAGTLRADLGSEVRSILSDRFLARASVGVEIVRLGPESEGDRILVRSNSDAPLTPASNMKLVTTSAALDLLGAGFHFRTVLAKRGEDLVLIGDGDPSFGDAELLKKVGWKSTTVFENWAAELKKAGLTRFRDVVVDDSVFDEVLVHPNWPPDQEQSRYVAQVAGMALNANCIDFYVTPGPRLAVYRTDPPTSYVKVQNTCAVGAESAIWLSRLLGTNNLTLRGTCAGRMEGPISVTMHDPAMYAATVLAETLAAGGIELSGQVRRNRSIRSELMKAPTDGQVKVLAVHETPLDVVIRRANKDSMNLYAESLCKRMGAVGGSTGSWNSGTQASGEFLKRLGIEEGQFRLDDGCGLSKQNAISAHAVTTVLRHNFHSSNRQLFLSTLAIGGEDGTLANRFKRNGMKARVLAKTGYISTVSALSGYVRDAEDQWFAFSILMSNLPPGSNTKAKAIQDLIVKAIDKAGAAQ